MPVLCTCRLKCLQGPCTLDPQPDQDDRAADLHAHLPKTNMASFNISPVGIGLLVCRLIHEDGQPILRWEAFV